MCLILLAWHSHPEYPLVAAANRDEFYARPTAPAAFWEDSPQVLAGRDLEASGTWLGITRTGRFAALTNYRDPSRNRTDAPSRGQLVSAFLRSAMAPNEYLGQIEKDAGSYNGFNLLFGDRDELIYFSNCGDSPRPLGAGIYGLSNHLLDTPWPKVEQGKTALAQALAALPDNSPLMVLLQDRHIAPDQNLPRTGVSLEWERLLSAAFIHSPAYGTRSSTTVIVDREGKVRFDELAFGADAEPAGRARFEFKIEA
jgi:uncharacterized protein with NRDE domain